nr:MAG TPA: hypothetical protein [Bacteriophage sp.]
MQYWYSKGTVKSRFFAFLSPSKSHKKKPPFLGLLGGVLIVFGVWYTRVRFALF